MRTIHKFYILPSTCHFFTFLIMTYNFTRSEKVELFFGCGLGRGCKSDKRYCFGLCVQKFSSSKFDDRFYDVIKWTFPSVSCNVGAEFTACFEKLRLPPKEISSSRWCCISAGLICLVYTTFDWYWIFVHLPFFTYLLCFMISTVNTNVVLRRSAV